MVDIPNSAKSRLRQGSGGTSAHPDANLLAAFSEQALAGTEREQVLAHLAQCADCREVVALSAPEAALPQTAYVPRGWFGMKPEFMRWAVVGASAAVVVAAVLLVRPELERAPMPGSVRMQTAESVQTAPVDGASSEVAPQKLAAPQKKDGEQEIVVTGARPQRPAMKIDGLDTPKMIASEPRVPSVAPAAPPPAPAQKPEQEYRYAASPVTGQAAGGAAGSGGGSKVAAAQTRDEKVGGLQVMEHPAANPMTAENESQGRAMALAKEKDAARADSLADAQAMKNEPAPVVAELKAQRAPAEVASGRLMTMRPAANVATRTWRIADGKLESSRDGGRTWARVDVPGGARFMAVDARPSSVWVGGTSGAVFRSPDGGATWIEVKHGWKGDVVYLKFADEKRGVVRTSAREEWFTEDGGEVWKKR